MRRLAYFLAANLIPVGLAAAPAAELDSSTKTKPAARPAASCGNHGTSVHFLATPSEAAKQARKERKLVFVLHVSGIFEDPNLT